MSYDILQYNAIQSCWLSVSSTIPTTDTIVNDHEQITLVAFKVRFSLAIQSLGIVKNMFVFQILRGKIFFYNIRHTGVFFCWFAVCLFVCLYECVFVSAPSIFLCYCFRVRLYV